MTLHIPFDNSYARLPADFYTRLKPEPVPAPKLVAFNEPLAEELGISGTDDPRLAPEQSPVVPSSPSPEWSCSSTAQPGSSECVWSGVRALTSDAHVSELSS